MHNHYSAQTRLGRSVRSGTNELTHDSFHWSERSCSDYFGLGLSTLATLLCLAVSASAQTFTFSTGNPDGLIATGSRPGSPGKAEIESADDFNLTAPVTINTATFTGLLPTGLPLSDITEVTVEIYRIFPNDSTFPADGRVNTRVNSPSDNAFLTRDSAAATLSFSATLLNPSFTVANTVLNGINPKPNQFTGGEGPRTGEEVQFNLTFSDPLGLPVDHYFFVPQAELTSGDFLWLSAPKPIVPPGTPFAPGSTDLQTWIRNTGLDPGWSRVGTDIVNGGPVNAAFSLSGTVPDAGSTFGLLGMTVVLIASLRRLLQCRPRFVALPLKRKWSTGKNPFVRTLTDKEIY